MIDQGRPGHCKGGVMRIRDLEWEGLPAWPPEWWVSDEGAGEEGILKNAQLRYDQTPACIAVVASHLGENRNGIIILGDPLHLEALCQKLEECIGRPLREIVTYRSISFHQSPRWAKSKCGLKPLRVSRLQNLLR
jgi:hypothetical protein